MNFDGIPHIKLLDIFLKLFGDIKTTLIFAPELRNGLWCNGNTTVFGAVFLGSSPSRPTKKPRKMRGFFYA
jgi:hypothetical protein